MKRYHYDDKKVHQCHFFVSDNEMAMIRQRMAYTGVNNMSDYLRRMAIDGGILVVDDAEELKRVAYEVNKIGVNINQIVHLANSSGSVSKDDISKLEELLVLVWQSLRLQTFDTV